MNSDKVLELIRDLYYSQGFYGRLLRYIKELTEEDRNRFMEQFKDCTDNLDVIFKLEG